MKRRTVLVLRRPRGRPLRPIPGRPKACPDGHAGRVILWNRRPWTSAPFRRQRVCCLPSDGARPHTFSLDRRPNTADHPTGERCPSCDVTPTATDGPLSPVDYFHSANEIGLLLGLVGRGTSLRAASRAVRLAAHRFVSDEGWTRRAAGEASRQWPMASPMPCGALTRSAAASRFLWRCRSEAAYLLIDVRRVSA